MTSIAGTGLAERKMAFSVKRLIATALILLLFAIQLATAITRQIHMDEFLYLTKIYQYEYGTLTQIIQTFYVHLFWWLTLLPGNDVDRIVAARLVMLPLHFATLYFIYKTARRFVSRESAFCVTMIYATPLYIVQFATSFRADGIIAALLMGAIYGLTRKRLSLGVLILSAVAVALAGLISIKSVFYIPIIAAIALWRLVEAGDWRALLAKMAIAFAVSAIAGGALLLLHTHSLGVAVGSAQGSLSGSVDKQLAGRDYFQTVFYLYQLMKRDLVQYILVIIGLLGTVAMLVAGPGVKRVKWLMMLMFAAPVLLVFLYRNSFPYFYVFMLPTVPLVTLSMFDPKRSVLLTRSAGVLAVVMVAQAAYYGVRQLPLDNSGQRALEEAVHEIFPKPVTYIDMATLIPSYPWAGQYMTTWGHDSYRARGEPVFAEAISREKPPLVVAAFTALEMVLREGAKAGVEGLFPQDVKALHENYVHQWGPIWVAGKELEEADGSPADFRIVIDGTYTFEANGAGRIDGKPVSPGDTVSLGGGTHSYAGPKAILRWGDHLPIPDRDPPGELYHFDPDLGF